MTPLSVRLKQFKRPYAPDVVSFINWVLITVNGNLYNISTSSNSEVQTASSIGFSVNNIARPPPYSDDKNGI